MAQGACTHRWIQHLLIYRLSDIDLFLSKLMRDDPIDLSDARWIAQRAGLDAGDIESAITEARVPDVPEIREQFKTCYRKIRAA